MAESAAVAATHQERSAGFLALMRNRNYALLWTGQLVSEMGNRFHWIAVSLWIYQLTHSATAVSLAISSTFVGSLLFGLWAGVFVDRFDRKRILILADILRAGLVALIPFFVSKSLWLVYADLVLISAATAFFRPAIFAIVPSIVSRRDLLPANSFLTAMDTGTDILGPLLAGVLAFSYGYPLLLYLDAATYLLSGLSILLMLLPHRPEEAQRFKLGQVWLGVAEGLRYIRTDRLQFGLFVLIFPATLVGAGLNALQTPLAKGVLTISDVQFGTYQSVWGVGFLVASLLVGWFGAYFRKSHLILGGYFIGFFATALMGLSRGYGDLLVTAFVVGFSNTLFYVALGTVLMEHTPGVLIGRVVSTRQVALAVMRVSSPLLFGILAEAIAVRAAVVSMAAIGAVSTYLAVVAFPVLRQLDGGKRYLLHASWVARLAGPVDPEYEVGQQQWLNLLSIVLVISVFIVVSLRSLPVAFMLLLGAVILGILGGRLRRRGWLP